MAGSRLHRDRDEITNRPVAAPHLERDRWGGPTLRTLAGMQALQASVGNLGVQRLMQISPVEKRPAGPLPSDLVQRRFGGDIEDLTASQVLERLKLRYPDKRVSYKDLNELAAEDKVYSFDDLAIALRLVPSDLPVIPTSQVGPGLQSGASTPVPVTLPPILVKHLPPSVPVSNVSGSSDRANSPSTLAVHASAPVASVGVPTGTGTATAFDEKRFQSLIAALFAKTKAPSRTDFMSLFKAEYHPGHIMNIVESQEFVYAFQEAVRRNATASGDFLSKTAITETTELPATKSYKMAGKAWTLRHYSDKGDDIKPPPFMEIKSTAAIALLPPQPQTGDVSQEKTKKSGHTGDRDWNKYGNTGSTFYLLYIDGQPVEKQKFLSNTKWYAEFPFEQPSLWVSSDWLDEKAIKGPALRGSGEAVKSRLLRLGGNTAGNQFIQTLMGHFHNLEVKVPGKLTVTQWHRA